MRYVYAIIALGLLIAFHELGHLLFARLLGVKVSRISIGFGPPIFASRKRRTTFTFGAIPLGASVRLYGMNPHEEGVSPEDTTTFLSQPPWKRILILASGSISNYLLALAVLVGLYMAGTHVAVPATVGAVDPGSPAARAQLRPGDVVVSVDKVRYSSWSALSSRVANRAGHPVELEVQREGTTQKLTVIPKADPHGQGRIGITQQYVYREHTFSASMGLAFRHVNAIIVQGAKGLVGMIQGKSGLPLTVTPVTMVRQASQVAASGWDAFLRVLVGISVALAVFNLLPFPALDGGRILLTVIESATGRRMNPKLETLVHAVGFFLLLGGVLFVAYAAVRDIVRMQGSPVPMDIPPPARLRQSGPQPIEEGEVIRDAGF